ncbi:MAG: DUF4199 domain-containing protein, partial [Bacteroidetes bacterium]|nr:DUF4199 domain-containing protein [Bacteroidota bacterium]
YFCGILYSNKAKLLENMNVEKLKIENVAIKYGLLTSVGLITFFLVAKLLGIVYFLELRILNLLFVMIGIFLAIRYYKKNNSNMLTYFQGLGIGMLTTLLAVAVFAIFLVLYLTIIDPALMMYIKENSVFGRYLNPFIIEGFGSGVISTFMIMQYLKNPYAIQVKNLINK